ncbi:MAG: TSUP family transporter [Candidatus Nanohaloarchaea archaeon]
MSQDSVFALVGTVLASMVFEPSKAVTLVLIPLIASQFDLIAKLDRSHVEICLERFKIMLLSSMTGSIAGVLLIDYLPSKILAGIIGVMTLAFVSYRFFIQDKAVKEFSRLQNAVYGLFSGVVFGSTNIGVSFVTFFDIRDLETDVFAGIVAFTMLVLGLTRVSISWATGLASFDIAYLSLIGAIPAVVGVKMGVMSRHRASEKTVEKLVLALLIIIGFRLLLKSFSI